MLRWPFCRTSAPPSSEPVERPFRGIIYAINELMDLHNAERRRARAAPLELKRALLDAAMGHAAWMSYHQSPAELQIPNSSGYTGGDLLRRVLAAGYHAWGLGENRNVGADNALEAVAHWIMAKPSRAIIRNPLYRHVGFGYAWDRDKRMYWCAVYGASVLDPETPVPIESSPTIQRRRHDPAEHSGRGL